MFLRGFFLDIGIYVACPADIAEEKQEATTRTNHLIVSFVIDPSNHAFFLDLVKEQQYLVSVF